MGLFGNLFKDGWGRTRYGLFFELDGWGRTRYGLFFELNYSLRSQLNYSAYAPQLNFELRSKLNYLAVARQLYLKRTAVHLADIIQFIQKESGAFCP